MRARDKYTIELINYALRRCSVYCDCCAISRIFSSHPLPDSIRAISDTLDELGVSNSVCLLTLEQLMMLKGVIIVPNNDTYKPYSIVVPRNSDSIFVFNGVNKSRVLPTGEFLKTWSGYALVVNEQSMTLSRVEKPFIYLIYLLGQLLWIFKTHTIAFTSCAYLLFLVLCLDSYEKLAFLFCSIIGLFCSMTLYLKEHSETDELRNVCGSGDYDKCKAFVGSDKAKIGGVVSMSDMSLAYFISEIFALSVPVLSLPELSCYFVLAIVPIVYSVVWMCRNRKACTLCLTIDFALLVQAILGFLNGVVISVHLLAFPAIFLFAYVLTLFVGELLSDRRNCQALKLYKQRLLLDSDAFWVQLESRISSMPNVSIPVISTGPRANEHKISIVINPHCRFCHSVYSPIWKLSGYDIELLFLTLDGDVEGESIAAYFVAKFFEENLTWEGISAEIEGYYLGYGDSAQYAYPEKYLEIVHSYREYCFDNKIYTTPTILVDGRRVPDLYGLADLKYIL